MIKAFVGHSFSDNDHEIVRRFLDFFDRVVKLGIGFTWDHAEPAEPKELSVKVKEKMDDKNLFIGICTSREKVIDINKIGTVPLIKNRFWGLENDFAIKTSDWILQEIGFAVGRNMNLIILLEDGVRFPGGIQGNLEYIPFARENPDRCFEKLLEMLHVLSVPASQARASELIVNEQHISKSEATEEIMKIEELSLADWKMEDYDSALINSIIIKDGKKEDDLFDKFTKSEFGKDPSKLIRWKARRLYLHALLRNENTLSELLSLLQNNPHNADILAYIAAVYELFSEFKRAASTYEESALITEDKDRRFYRLTQASNEYAKIGDKNKVISINNQARSLINQIDNGKVEMLNLLADTSYSLGDYPSYKAFTEASLEFSPDDHDRRFNLAYRYSENSEQDFAFFHYNILTNRNPDETNLNNFGVTLERLNLNFSAVQAYRASEKLGGTLAMSNIAAKFIKEGFLNEANEIIKKATSMDNFKWIRKFRHEKGHN